MKMHVAILAATQPLRQFLHRLRVWFANDDCYEDDARQADFSPVRLLARHEEPHFDFLAYAEGDLPTRSACGFTARCRAPFQTVRRLDVARALDRLVNLAETSSLYREDERKAVRGAALFLQTALELAAPPETGEAVVAASRFAS